MPIAKEQIRQIISENNITSVADVYSLLRDSFKDILQELMEAEMDATLGYEKNQKGDLQSGNKRNGHSARTLKSQYGEFQIDIPRDRNGEFEPKLVPRYQRDISGIEEKVISLYARGMGTRDIHDQLKDLYGVELSAEMVSKITDRILPQVREWQTRPLHAVYPFVFMDCIHYKVREEGRILSRAACVVLGVAAEGYRDILSITVGANETGKFRLGMLNDLKNRGLRDVLFFCVDGPAGFKEAVSAVYPDAQIQRCVIHMLRNSFKYVNYQDLKKFSSDFRAVYNAPTEAAALSELEEVREKWGKKYPCAISNRERTGRTSVPFSRGRVWAEPTKKGISANVLFPMQKIHSGCINKRILVILKSEGRFDSRKCLKPTTNFYISNSYPGKHGLPKTQNQPHRRSCVHHQYDDFRIRLNFLSMVPVFRYLQMEFGIYPLSIDLCALRSICLSVAIRNNLPMRQSPIVSVRLA